MTYFKANQTFSERFKKARLRKGYTRQDIAQKLHVNVTAVAGWETGKFLPRENKRLALEHLLGGDIFSDLEEAEDGFFCSYSNDPTRGRELAAEYARNAYSKVKIFRAGHNTPLCNSNYMREYRSIVHRRLLAEEIAIHTVEIFYRLDRLCEALSNVLRYKGNNYRLKSYAFANDSPLSIGGGCLVPAIDTYAFDDETFLMGGYWTYDAVEERPMLQVRGSQFKFFFQEHWGEVWRNALSMTMDSDPELSSFKKIALRLGLAPQNWNDFLDKAKSLGTETTHLPLP